MSDISKLEKQYFSKGKFYKHREYMELPLTLIVPSKNNPNEMTAEEFNLLDESIQDFDCLEPIVVVPDYKQKRFKIIGGEHRWDVMRIADAESIPAIIADPERVDEIKQMELMGKLNFIKGKPNKEKFQSFVNTYIEQTGVEDPDILAHKFGMSNTAEFQSMLDNVEKTLPNKDMKNKFKAVKHTVKDVDDLSNILNRLFAAHGDTIPAGYMVFDFGGQEHIWVKVESQYMNNVKDVALEVKEAGYTFDSYVLALLLTAPVDKFIAKNKDALVGIDDD